MISAVFFEAIFSIRHFLVILSESPFLSKFNLLTFSCRQRICRIFLCIMSKLFSISIVAHSKSKWKLPLKFFPKNQIRKILTKRCATITNYERFFLHCKNDFFLGFFIKSKILMPFFQFSPFIYFFTYFLHMAKTAYQKAAKESRANKKSDPKGYFS